MAAHFERELKATELHTLTGPVDVMGVLTSIETNTGNTTSLPNTNARMYRIQFQ